MMGNYHVRFGEGDGETRRPRGRKVRPVPTLRSGNFLYVALKQLLDLEKQVITLGADLGLSRMIPLVGPEQLHGIEVNEYAHELAQVTVWIGYIQRLRDNGFGEPSQPILQTLTTIQNMDAILAFDAEGKPVEPTWPEADVIIGNPPFLGGSKLRRELGHSYSEHLWLLYKDRVPGGADLVCYWFERARAYIKAGITQRAGLLTTQAIRAGANRKVLERIKDTGNIFMAWGDRPWVLDGAAVRVSMIGFDDGKEQDRTLNGAIVAEINADLTGSLNLTFAQRLRENSNLAFVGSQKGGAFDISAEQAEQMLVSTGNQNKRPNSEIVKPSVNGLDVMGRPRNAWIIDFGVGISEAEAATYILPFAYVKKHVYPERSQNRRASYAQKWWQHAEPRPGMRAALRGLPRFIATVRVAKHRVFVWLAPPALPDHKLCVIARTDDYFFGILHSRVHEVWSLANASTHGDGSEGGRPVYNNTTCFETYPFPWPPGREPQDDDRVVAIATAAQHLVVLRDAWLNEPGLSEAALKQRTLTNLYNARPNWLAEAHQALDAAVLAAYGWPADMGDEEILARLLALNLERAAAQGGVEAGGGDGE